MNQTAVFWMYIDVSFLVSGRAHVYDDDNLDNFSNYIKRSIMPKRKITVSEKLSSYTSIYANEFKKDNNILYCKFCECPVSCDRPFQVQQHRDTDLPYVCR